MELRRPRVCVCVSARAHDIRASSLPVVSPFAKALPLQAQIMSECAALAELLWPPPLLLPLLLWMLFWSLPFTLAVSNKEKERLTGEAASATSRYEERPEGQQLLRVRREPGVRFQRSVRRLLGP